uniref:Uncharacterized protein n=1 Tax=Serinus canaria TaxID=9135 RepID=A0A8C9MGU3_SERCA
ATSFHQSNTFIFPPEPAWLQTSCFSIRDCNVSGKDYVTITFLLDHSPFTQGLQERKRPGSNYVCDINLWKTLALAKVPSITLVDTQHTGSPVSTDYTGHGQKCSCKLRK